MMTRYFTVLLLLLLSPARAEQSNEDLLEADQAFQLSTRTVNGTTLETRWKIAPDYYLYRDKFEFEAIEGGTLKDPVFPHGKKKQDPLFGTVETYTKSVKVRLPIKRQGSAPSLRLRITAQGCNEPVGVCYPPIVKEVDFKLPPVKASRAPVAAVAATPVGEVRSLKDLTQSTTLGSGAAEPVDPETAFRMNITARGNEALLASIDIADCCYLYRDKMKFELTAADGSALPADVRLGSVELPAGKIKTDEFIGKTEIYETGFEVALPIAGGAAPDRDMSLHVTYQGCSEKGVIICYPPVTKKFGVQFRAGALSVAAGPEAAAASPVVPPTRDTGKLMVAMLAAFGAGLLLSFTPCVLPMVPILSGVIVGTEGTHITKLRGGLLSYSYVLGTSFTYTVAGAIAGATGEQLQAYFQTTWAIGTFAALLVLLALSMFGFYQLQVPSSIQSLLHHHSTRMHHQVKQWLGGELIGAFILGLISALIIGACVSPVLVSVLGAAIAAKDPVLGGALMFALAHGQGAILIALGIGAGFLLPKVGKWMDSVKHLFGALLIAVAIYLLGYLPQVPVLFLWAALLIVSAVYLGATQSLPESAGGWSYLWKGIGTVLLIWGGLALLGGFAGNRDILRPLPLTSSSISMIAGGAGGAAAPAAAEHPFERIYTLRDLEDRLASAKAAGKPVIVDYYATWCTDCLRMEKSTFADTRVRAELEHFVRLQPDVTNSGAAEVEAMKKRFKVYGPPAVVLLNNRGEQRSEAPTYGFHNVEEMLTLLGNT